MEIMKPLGGLEQPKKLTREEVVSKLEKGGDLENLVLSDLDLSGLNLEGKSFRGSDIRGVTLYRKEEDKEVKTNVKGADFSEAVIADLGPEVFFGRVDAEGAVFGYKESLSARRKRHKDSGVAPKAGDTGGLFNFNGSEGNFKKTKWTNADFGGRSGYEAIFPGAIFSEAIIEGCDLSGIDFSEVKIDDIKIIDPVSLVEMKINKNQIKTVAQAIQLADEKEQADFAEKIKKDGPEKVLVEYFSIVILD